MPRSKSTEANEVRALLEWARGAGIELSTVTVGSCTVTVGRVMTAPRKREPEEPRGIYHAFGGQALSEVAAMDLGGGEYEPAIARK